MPKLMGQSKKTLTEDNELFLFDDEVEPILQVLCGKTLELSQMEVLQEEEIKEMLKQQSNFKTMMENDNAEIRKMEEQERKRLEAYEAKKSIEKQRKKTRQAAHEKIVCRNIAKMYLRDVKANSYVMLKDLAFFRDDFREVTMFQDVMPWIMSRTEGFVRQFNDLDQYPSTMVARHIDEASQIHMQKVNERMQHLEAIRHAKMQAEEDKADAKLQRQRIREEKKR